MKESVAETEDWKLVRLKVLGIAHVLALDPEWKLCCVACKCVVPPAEGNVTAHVSGKKHIKNTNKLTTAELIKRKKRVISPNDLEYSSTPDGTSASDDTWTISRQRSSVEEVCDSSASSDDSCSDLSTSTVSPNFDIPLDQPKFIDAILSGGHGTDIWAEEESTDAAWNGGSRDEGFCPLDSPAFSGTTFFTSMPHATRQPHLARRLRELTDSQAVKKKSKSCSDLSRKLNNAQDYLLLASKKEKEGSCHQSEINESGDEEMPPWVIDPDSVEAITHSNCGTLVLHYEILEFCRFMSPTKIERDIRKRICSTVRNVAKALWPGSEVYAYGSYVTGLCLPSSDIDLCVMNTPGGGTQAEQEEFARAIRNLPVFARRVRTVDARVGIVKIVSRDGNVPVDVSFGNMDGVSNLSLIRAYLRDYPALRPIVLVIKCFLEQRGLNNHRTGGIGSYSTTILVLSHLQMLRHNYPDIEHNLGAVLIAFFDLYGWLFNLCSAGIAVKENGTYYEKVKRYNTQADETVRFSMEDPDDPDHEIGRNSWCSELVRKAFQDAYMSLSLWRRDDPSHSISPLSRIIVIERGFKERRTMVTRDLENPDLLELTKYIARNVSISSPTSG